MEIKTNEFIGYSLEELREQHDRISDRYGRKGGVVITEVPNVKKTKRTEIQKYPSLPYIEYEEGRRYFWRIYKSELDRRKEKVVMSTYND